MRTDYFNDLLPDSVTHVTQPKTERVTPETDKVTKENNDLPEASRTSRTSRTKTGSTEHDEAIREHLEERAAIQEYDGGLTRKQAETEARRNLKLYRYRLVEFPDNELILIAPGTSLQEAERGLRLKYGKRLIDVKAYKRQAPADDGANNGE